MKSDSELQKLRYDNKELREAIDRLLSERSTRIETLEAALRRAYGFLQDKSFIPDSLTRECTKVLEEMEAALAPEQDK